MKSIGLLVAGVMGCVVALAEPSLQIASDYTQHMRIYKEAVPVERPSPNYPRSARRNHNEGWVILSFIIDEQGNPQTPIVLESAGNASFERAATQALMRSKFRPATLNGEPVESCDNKFKYTFAMGNKQGATPEFISSYSHALQLLEEGALDEVAAIIEQLPNERQFSHYEDNWLQWLKANYFRVTGDSKSELAALRKGFEFNLPEMTSNSVYATALWRIVELSISQHDIATAEIFADKLKEHLMTAGADDEIDPELEQRVSEKLALLKGTDQFSVDKQIGERGFFEASIVRPQFTLQGDITRIREMQLRCDAKRLEMAVETEVRVKIPDSWGDCQLFVKGEQGAPLTLVQHTDDF